MYLKKNFPLLVACYVVAVGLFFSVATFFDISSIGLYSTKPKTIVTISFLLIISGAYYSYRSLKGKLEPEGKSVTEIRKQAIEKIKTESYLAKIAKEDSDSEVRKKAIERLQALEAQH